MCEPVKGTKVGVVEETASPSPVAAMESGILTNDTISEKKQDMLKRIVENCTMSEELIPEQRKQFYLLLLANADVSADNNPGRTNLIKHHINTGSSPPVWQPVRRVSAHKREEASHLLKGMLDKKIIQPSTSPWVSPIVLVPKKGVWDFV